MSQETLPVIQLDTIRHPKMAAIKAPYLEKMVDELAVDQKLGLENQSRIDSQELFKRDVDELTSSNEYYQVNKELIKRMFNISHLNFLCLWHNVKETTSKVFLELWAPLSIMLASCVFILPAIELFRKAAYASHHDKDPSGWAMLGIACCIVTVTAIIMTLMRTFQRSRNITVPDLYNKGSFRTSTVEGLYFEFSFLKVDLKMETIKDTNVKIPFAVKCKILEAKEKEIFKDFVIGYPQFDVVSKQVNIKLPELPKFSDPVVLGMSQDGRMFLIAWWDIKHDIDKVKNNIKFFKKLKVEA